MKQTAVEWLQQALEDTILTHEQIMQTVGLFEQAKEMEQEQIIDFARNIIIDATCSVEGYVTTEKDIEEYYNETFKANEK
jgi:hypothetical protein